MNQESTEAITDESACLLDPGELLLDISYDPVKANMPAEPTLMIV